MRLNGLLLVIDLHSAVYAPDRCGSSHAPGRDAGYADSAPVGAGVIRHPVLHGLLGRALSARLDDRLQVVSCTWSSCGVPRLRAPSARASFGSRFSLRASRCLAGVRADHDCGGVR
jgi:hypothetical protein